MMIRLLFKRLNSITRVFLFIGLLSIPALAQNIPIVKFDRLEKIIHSRSDSIVVINFWATWCGPCVKELPLFEQLHTENPEIKMVLVNLDFADKVDKVKEFVNRKKLTSSVILLDEIDYNSWIDKVDTAWGGAIPATLIINQNTGQRKFVDHELHSGELQKLIDLVK
ncbi:MAG TPA: redoxin domain-containing protein [Ohtaekwangia sp.]